MENSSRFVWFVTGAALGAGIALLYAPHTGKDTRRFIGKKARQHGETVADAGRDVLDKGRDLYDKGRKMADEAADLFERGRRLVQG
jgi:gas vesicle protein